MFKKTKDKGFTLLELMIVVAIAAIILTIGVPSFRAMIEKNRLKGTAETLYADLQFARLESIKQNRNITIHFAGSGGPPWTTWCYGLDDTGNDCDCKDNIPACTIQGVQKIVDNTDYPDITLNQNFAFNAANSGITGFESVRSMSLDNGTATFRSSNNDEVDIVLSNLGRMRICSDDLWDYENCP